MSCFPCCTSEERIKKRSLKKSIKQYHDAKILTSFANISFKTGKLISKYLFYYYLMYYALSLMLFELPINCQFYPNHLKWIYIMLAQSQ